MGLLSLTAALIIFARRFTNNLERGWARYSIATVIVFVGFAAFGLAGGDIRFVLVAVIVGWGWAALVAARLSGRVTP